MSKKPAYFGLFQITLCGLVFWFSVTASAKEPAFAPVETGVFYKETQAGTLKVDLNGAVDLYLVATFGGDNYDFDQAIWAEPTLYDADGNAVQLTSLTPVSAKTGWGTLLVNENHQKGTTFRRQRAAAL